MILQMYHGPHPIRQWYGPPELLLRVLCGEYARVEGLSQHAREFDPQVHDTLKPQRRESRHKVY